ncbi:MAG: hypothetical protein R6U68_12855 [Desulfobacteraceae bacterium]
MGYQKYSDLINKQDLESGFKEISDIIHLLGADKIVDDFTSAFQDIVRLFNGDYPGYRASNTRYHDLDHTIMVALTTARLICGCMQNRFVFDHDNILTGLLAALFHDSGLIQTQDDLEGTGAKHTLGHEERSAAFMQEYLSKKGVSAGKIINCSHMIKTTNLNLDTKEIPFSSRDVEILGKIVGSADLLAQMAERSYLEKLFLLYQEFEEAGISVYESEAQLLFKTRAFYDNVVNRRLKDNYENIASNMRFYFKKRWGIDKDLYDMAIQKNLLYLKQICENEKDCERQKLIHNLRRDGILREEKLKEQRENDLENRSSAP